MSKCIICNQIIQTTFSNLLCESNVCYSCLMKFKRRNEYFEIEGVKGYVLYWYDEFFKELLFKYKGCYDYVLKDAFLEGITKELNKKYSGYTIVLAPSNEEDEKKRKFNHLEEIFLSLRLDINKCFYKTRKWKQSDKNFEERKQIERVIKLNKNKLKKVNKILIVDDVLTSGSTIKTMIRQLPTNMPKKVLVLSSNCRFKANEIS